ncbi:hypothetical protein PVAG01_06532 [Phlyctema vagabunda]|uniref:Uncharacterized protein n=1 Tax=Phlyctema vagabunda TaxID=108571 RepID=A0ABR4PH94_9HELO
MMFRFRVAHGNRRQEATGRDPFPRARGPGKEEDIEILISFNASSVSSRTKVPWDCRMRKILHSFCAFKEIDVDSADAPGFLLTFNQVCVYPEDTPRSVSSVFLAPTPTSASGTGGGLLMFDR